MFHPTFDPKGMNDQDLESKINDVTIKINQAKRMNHSELYNQLLAVNNNLQIEKEERKMKKSNDKEQIDSNLDGLINVE